MDVAKNEAKKLIVEFSIVNESSLEKGGYKEVLEKLEANHPELDFLVQKEEFLSVFPTTPMEDAYSTQELEDEDEAAKTDATL
ncbi:Hypothetical predicted protein [Olea europaea subsp. europaea]|uniref:Uncharacterized protein n=1 Tax=Olea europaea subsp. europaea TaxID=158383 RepID=A0A8S0TA18_OLEEU|nr:Hypothetical predicted protein [Olea europaea subsp. europaea]